MYPAHKARSWRQSLADDLDDSYGPLPDPVATLGSALVTAPPTPVLSSSIAGPDPVFLTRLHQSLECLESDPKLKCLQDWASFGYLQDSSSDSDEPDAAPWSLRAYAARLFERASRDIAHRENQTRITAKPLHEQHSREHFSHQRVSRGSLGEGAKTPRDQMADPLSVVASLLAVATAGVQSTRSLKDAVKRYKTRNSILRRLLGEIEDTENILSALKDLLESDTLRSTPEADISMAVLLRRPIERCSEECDGFQVAMEQFSMKSKTNIIDWTKMEFMRGDMNQFMENVEGYKATITVGLGVLTMHTAKLSHQALEEYEELVKNTISELTLWQQRIDEQLQNLTTISGPLPANTGIDLTDERQVTEQCLRVCQNAMSHLELLSKDSTLQEDVPSSNDADDLHNLFEAQLLTRKALGENQASLVNIITRLRERLQSVVSDGDASERIRLQEDIRTSKECLEVCQLATKEVTSQKIHIVGNAVADGDSDQVVVTTLADMFKVGNTTSKNRSALLVGSMSDEAFMKASHDRYNSRFGLANTVDYANQTEGVGTNLGSLNPGPASQHQRHAHMRASEIPPSSNETRKRG